MFISAKRHEREIQALATVPNRLTDALLNHVSQGAFLVDSKDRILLPVSRSMSTLFRRRDFTRLTFAKLLKPLVAEKALNDLCAELADVRAGTARVDAPAHKPLHGVELRLPKSGGEFDTVRYTFDFFTISVPDQEDMWLVRVTDRSLYVEHARELEELHSQLVELRSSLQIQTEVLRSLWLSGRGRFVASLQRGAAAMKAIKLILKKPAREEAAFRLKLEETLGEVAHVRRAANSLKLGGMETAARRFEESLQELKSRETLSGNDFLPVALQLDDLFGQFNLVRSLTRSVVAAKSEAAADDPLSDGAAPAAGGETVTEPGILEQAMDQVMEMEKTIPQKTNPRAVHIAPAGSLEHTLCSLAEHVALEQQKSVTLKCAGLKKVPAAYQSAVKNIAIQFIRNSVIHGIEPPMERERAGKPPVGQLRLRFNPIADRGFEMRFDDDGRGIDPLVVRKVAVEKHLLSRQAADRLRDRQVIKLIFRDGFTLLAQAADEPAHGSGLSFVRRYVHDAGGKIALASEPGRETRFKVCLPALGSAASGANADDAAAGGPIADGDKSQVA